MKKPDMPIYVPRGRRLAAESELSKLGEEDKLDIKPKKPELELDTDFLECKSESILFSKEQNRILSSSEQVPTALNGNADTVSKVKTKCQGKKKTLKTVASDSSSEESHGQKKMRSGLKANVLQKKNLTPTEISSQGRSSDSVEVANNSTGSGGISVTAVSHISKATNCDEKSSAHTGNCSERSVDSLSADCHLTETSLASVGAGDASAMSSSIVTTGHSVLVTSNNSVEQNQDLDHSATNCTELGITNENKANCSGKLSRPSSQSNASDEQSWDALFDESGEALHPDVMNQVTVIQLYYVLK